MDCTRKKCKPSVCPNIIVRSKSAKGHNECCLFDFKFKGECCVMLINKKPSIKPCFMYYVRMVRLLSNILTVFQTRGGGYFLYSDDRDDRRIF